MKPWRDGYEKPALHARLCLAPGSESTVIPDLYWAHVKRITAHGIHVAGIEVVPRRSNNKASADRYPQSWWCLVHTADGEAFLENMLDPIIPPHWQTPT